MIHKNILKSYAPEARKEFIKAVTERAAYYGITESKILPCEIKGDFAFISGRPFPKDIDKRRNDLILRVQKAGFHQTMEEIAYTWFNRFIAIRFMEVNGYLSHGYRVLSHPEEGHNEPEILEKAQFIEKLDGLEKDEIVKLKTAIGKESELYRKLIIAQCSDLSTAMPFLFEHVDDPTELLLPDNLLNTDSLVRKMVTSIPEEDWKEVEIVGWLYQFYISERKDELMQAKKAYKTEEIPAVTQLFTPNWIVKYLVQNSLGAKWLGTYPKSALKEKMEYYIAPAEQTDEVNTKVKEITSKSLDPEELTILDPACGSGHILVEAYALLKEIYLERGYRIRDIAGLILTKNLFGLEIDERAAQLASFAILMKAYADDREIFKKGIKPNIICFKSAQGTGNYKQVQELVDLFEYAKTFGSLIRVPEQLILRLPDIKKDLQSKRNDLNKHMFGEGVDFYDQLLGLAQQAEILSKRYDCVVANPPYMGSHGMNVKLKEFVLNNYSDGKQDLYSCFIIKNLEFSKQDGFIGMITIPNWMFLSSFENVRKKCITEATIYSLVHNGRGVWGSDFGSCSFIIKNEVESSKQGIYYRLFSKPGEVSSNDELEKNFFNEIDFPHYQASSEDLKKIPGAPIAYWVSDKVRKVFENGVPFCNSAEIRSGVLTGNDELFVREWQEIDQNNFGKGLSDYNEMVRKNKKWIPITGGGDCRKWYGSLESVVNLENEGKDIKSLVGNNYRLRSPEYYFREGVNWKLVTSGKNSFRISPKHVLFGNSVRTAFCAANLYYYLGAFNSCVIEKISNCINPTLNLNNENVEIFPVFKPKEDMSSIKTLIQISQLDWDSSELSWDFKELSILNLKNKKNSASESYQSYRNQCRNLTEEMRQIEEENNRFFIKAYNLQNELSPEVPIQEITLFANPKYRYRGELSDIELEVRFKNETFKELISYAIGCMMGRYSLGIPGLVYAHAGNGGFDSKKYKIFPADHDGIIPIADGYWFDDDVSCQFFRFIETAWDKKGLDGNLDFIADAISRKSGESSRETIRKYFVNDFYKNHCKTYKNRPIYWLFTSGKEKAFQALVYLHRYNEGTLARMRTEYVLPLQTKIMRHIDQLEKDKDIASGSSANKIQKEITTLRKQQTELAKFDEKLRHYADMKIELDLDDGVKANYVKFGELLEPIKGLKYGSEED